MSKFSKNKGKRGEREVVLLLQEVVNRVYAKYGVEPVKLERNLMQSHRGGYDIVGLPWLALEVKFVEQFQINQWWKQTVQQAGEGQEPVLFYRKSRVQWRVKMVLFWKAGNQIGRVGSGAEVALSTFLKYFEARLEEDLKESNHG